MRVGRRRSICSWAALLSIPLPLGQPGTPAAHRDLCCSSSRCLGPSYLPLLLTFSPQPSIFPSYYKTFHRRFLLLLFLSEFYSWHIIPCCTKSTLVKAAAFEWLTRATARRSVNLVQQEMGSQLQKEKRGLILRFKMVKMSEGREIYTKYKKGVEQRKKRKKEKRGWKEGRKKKMMLHNGTKLLVNKIRDLCKQALSS